MEQELNVLRIVLRNSSTSGQPGALLCASGLKASARLVTKLDIPPLSFRALSAQELLLDPDWTWIYVCRRCEATLSTIPKLGMPVNREQSVNTPGPERIHRRANTLGVRGGSEARAENPKKTIAILVFTVILLSRASLDLSQRYRATLLHREHRGSGMI